MTIAVAEPPGSALLSAAESTSSDGSAEKSTHCSRSVRVKVYHNAASPSTSTSTPLSPAPPQTSQTHSLHPRRTSLTLQPASLQTKTVVELTVNVDEFMNAAARRAAVIAAMNASGLPPSMEPAIRATVSRALKTAVDAERNAEIDEAFQRLTDDNRQRAGDAYRLAYRQCSGLEPQLEDPSATFTRAYAALVKSTDSSIFDTVLQLEKSYAQAMEEMISQHDAGFREIQSRHEAEISKVADSSRTDSQLQGLFGRLSAQHLEEMELFQATTASEMQDLQTTQRKEYREFVVKVYEELKARSSHTQASEPPPPTPARPPLSRKPSWTDVSGGNQSRTLSRSTSQDLFFGKASPSGGRTGDGTAVVTAAIRKLEKRPSQEILSLDSKSQPLDKMGAAADPESLKKTKEIEDMGFTKEQAVAALDLSGRNLEEAIMLLLEQPERIAERISFVQNEARKPLSPSPSLSNLRRPFSGSATPWNSTPRFPSRFLGTSGSGSSTPNTESVPAGGRRGFSPLAFIQQQQQKLVATTASSQGLKRMSSFLGKAMEALGMEDLERGKEVNDFADLSETFTTYFGTQVRTMYNLRLSVCSFGEQLFRVDDPALETAIRAQTAASLYSESLCGVILVIRAKEVMKGYASGKGGSKGLIQQCKRTTEFHFDDFETQMKAIEMKFKRNNEGSPILREGDFFITKHSNIPRIHVVFHLVIEEESIKDLNPRSAILTGYRNILKIAQQCDVNDITVPILLLPTGGDPFAVVSLTPSSNMPGNGSSLPPPSPLNSPTPTFSSDASLLKRAELVLKATKGQLMEQSWATKHAGDSSGVDKKGKAIQFGLQVEALGAGRGAWAVEELFAGGRERLMEVFKTT